MGVVHGVWAPPSPVSHAAPAGSGAATASGVGYRIEQDAIPELITQLRVALEHLHRAHYHAGSTSSVLPPGADPSASPLAADG